MGILEGVSCEILHSERDEEISSLPRMYVPYLQDRAAGVCRSSSGRKVVDNVKN